MGVYIGYVFVFCFFLEIKCFKAQLL